MQPEDNPVHHDDTTGQKPTLPQGPNSDTGGHQNVTPQPGSGTPMPGADTTTQTSSSQTGQPSQPTALSQKSVVTMLMSLVLAVAVGLFLVLLNVMGGLPVWAKYVAI